MIWIGSNETARNSPSPAGQAGSEMNRHSRRGADDLFLAHRTDTPCLFVNSYTLFQDSIPKRAQSIDFNRFKKCRGAIQNILKTREIFGQMPGWTHHLVQGKMLREDIGFGREDSFQSLIFHESKRQLHKPHLHSNNQVPPKPNTSAASLFNSQRFYLSVQLNSWGRICG